MEAAAPELSPMEMFADFYMKLNGKEMSEEQAAFLGRKIEKIWEDEG